MEISVNSGNKGLNCYCQTGVVKPAGDWEKAGRMGPGAAWTECCGLDGAKREGLDLL